MRNLRVRPALGERIPEPISRASESCTPFPTSPHARLPPCGRSPPSSTPRTFSSGPQPLHGHPIPGSRPSPPHCFRGYFSSTRFSSQGLLLTPSPPTRNSKLTTHWDSASGNSTETQKSNQGASRRHGPSLNPCNRAGVYTALWTAHQWERPSHRGPPHLAPPRGAPGRAEVSGKRSFSSARSSARGDAAGLQPAAPGTGNGTFGVRTHRFRAPPLKIAQLLWAQVLRVHGTYMLSFPSLSQEDKDSKKSLFFRDLLAWSQDRTWGSVSTVRGLCIKILLFVP